MRDNEFLISKKISIFPWKNILLSMLWSRRGSTHWTYYSTPSLNYVVPCPCPRVVFVLCEEWGEAGERWGPGLAMCSVCLSPPDAPHTSHLTPHTSLLTPHTSHLTCCCFISSAVTNNLLLEMAHQPTAAPVRTLPRTPDSEKRTDTPARPTMGRRQ